MSKEINIKIEDKKIRVNDMEYNVTEIPSGATSSMYKNKQYVFKKIKKYPKYNVFEREIYLLEYLNENNIDFVPKLIHYDRNTKIMMMTNCGEVLNNRNKPKNYIEQCNKILLSLKSLNIQHNDIKKNQEVLVLNNKVYICDFGWGSINNSLSCGINLWGGKKPWGITSDNRILNF